MVPGTGPISISGTAVTPENGSGTAQHEQRMMHIERRISGLEESLRELREELRYLRDSRRDNIPTAAEPRFCDLVAITEQMFGTPEVTVLRDPEDPDVDFIVFTVKCAGEPDEIVEKRIEWHNRIDRIPSGSSGRFRLSVSPTR